MEKRKPAKKQPTGGVPARAAVKVAVTKAKSDAHFSVARFIEIVGVHRHEFMKKLESMRPESVGKTPQKADLYHLRDLISVHLGGDHEAEKFRKTREEADKIAFQNMRSRGEMIEISEVIDLTQGFFSVLRTKIMGFPISEDERDALLVALGSFRAVDWTAEAHRCGASGRK